MKALSIERFKVLSGSTLKLIACISMFIDHATKFYLYKFQWIHTVWFTVAGRVISPINLMLLFGRFAFPIFVFLLVIGFEKTRDRTRYGISLFILALLSEIPFDLAISHSMLYHKQNVMFTLLIGYLAMCSVDYFKNKPVFSLISVIGLFLVSRYLKADYQSAGYVFILIMYGLRNEKIIRSVVAPVLLQMKAMVFLSMVLTLMYNGQRGFIRSPFAKYCFYAFYPVHLLLIYFLYIWA